MKLLLIVLAALSCSRFQTKPLLHKVCYHHPLDPSIIEAAQEQRGAFFNDALSTRYAHDEEFMKQNNHLDQHLKSAEKITAQLESEFPKDGEVYVYFDRMSAEKYSQMKAKLRSNWNDVSNTQLTEACFFSPTPPQPTDEKATILWAEDYKLF